MGEPENENSNGHMLESESRNPSESSEFGSDVESTSSSPRTNTTSSRTGQDEVEPLVQYDPTKGNVVFKNNSDDKETDSTSCDCCVALEKENEEYSRKIAALEEKYTKLEQYKNDLNSKLELALHQKDLATKEKEAMVIRYAVSEKNTLEERNLKEKVDKKYKEVIRENEILQHKLTTYTSEKNRIAQMLDNKVCIFSVFSYIFCALHSVICSAMN